MSALVSTRKVLVFGTELRKRLILGSISNQTRTRDFHSREINEESPKVLITGKVLNIFNFFNIFNIFGKTLSGDFNKFAFF